MLKLNIGCGHNKIPGCINIDADASCEPDLCVDITAALPYAAGHVGEIHCYHTIEHIKSQYHPQIVKEFNRVLAPSGDLYLSYPEGKVCFENWRKNLGGQREFFEATILGRGLTYWDLHKTLMDSCQFVSLLQEYGFSVQQHTEPEQPFNTVLLCKKIYSLNTKEELFQKELLNAAAD